MLSSGIAQQDEAIGYRLYF